MQITYLLFRIPQILGNKTLFRIITSTILICSYGEAIGQVSGGGLIGASLNTIPTSVPFLTIAPDGRSSGMGDAGAATSPDASSQHWNSGKYAFAERTGGVAITYTPWLRNLIPDINLLYFAGFYKINDKNTLSSSFRYFSLGTISIGIGPHSGIQYYPREMAVDAGYSRKLTDRFSGGVVFRYIHSDLTSGRPSISGQTVYPGTSFAGDLGLYYQNNIQAGEKDVQWAIGLNISNVGIPISYTKDDEKTPIPTNVRLGGRFSYNINENNAISLHADLNKMLVPTPGVYDTDSATGDLVLIRGREAPRSLILGMFRSFYDAPGVQRSDGTYSVAREELNEITYSLGAEYWYRKQFAFRTGYFHEHAYKGNRQYVTAGICVKNQNFSLEIAYLAPTNGQNSPLANTFRITFTTEFNRIST